MGHVAQLEHGGLVRHVQALAEPAQGGAQMFDDRGGLTGVLRRSISSSGLAPRKPSTLKTMHVGYRASSLDRTSEMTKGRLALTSIWRASTTLPSAPPSMRGTAPATRRTQSSWSITDVRVNWLGAGRGALGPPRASAT